MDNLQRYDQPSGLRLMQLLNSRLPELVRLEDGRESQIRLYGTGDCWVAFEESAYRLCRLFPQSETAVATHAAYPFPAVMATITDAQLRAYTRRHLLRRDEPMYKELIAPEVPAHHYRAWHRREIAEWA